MYYIPVQALVRRGATNQLLLYSLTLILFASVSYACGTIPLVHKYKIWTFLVHDWLQFVPGLDWACWFQDYFMEWPTVSGHTYWVLGGCTAPVLSVPGWHTLGLPVFRCHTGNMGFQLFNLGLVTHHLFRTPSNLTDCGDACIDEECFNWVQDQGFQCFLVGLHKAACSILQLAFVPGPLSSNPRS
jgi:hypothetical protein